MKRKASAGIELQPRIRRTVGNQNSRTTHPSIVVLASPPENTGYLGLTIAAILYDTLTIIRIAHCSRVYDLHVQQLRLTSDLFEDLSRPLLLAGLGKALGDH
jgi:hypothetical protein